MLIEDDPLSLESLSSALTLNGFDTKGFSSPLEAVQEYDSIRTKVVITDFHLPHINGIGVLKEIKKKNPYAMVIVISGDGKKEISSGALAAGADAFFHKPIDIVKLIERMASAAYEPGETISSR